MIDPAEPPKNGLGANANTMPCGVEITTSLGKKYRYNADNSQPYPQGWVCGCGVDYAYNCECFVVVCVCARWQEPVLAAVRLFVTCAQYDLTASRHTRSEPPNPHHNTFSLPPYPLSLSRAKVGTKFTFGSHLGYVGGVFAAVNQVRSAAQDAPAAAAITHHTHHHSFLCCAASRRLVCVHMCPSLSPPQNNTHAGKQLDPGPCAAVCQPASKHGDGLGVLPRKLERHARVPRVFDRARERGLLKRRWVSSLAPAGVQNLPCARHHLKKTRLPPFPRRH